MLNHAIAIITELMEQDILASIEAESVNNKNILKYNLLLNYQILYNL